MRTMSNILMDQDVTTKLFTVKNDGITAFKAAAATIAKKAQRAGQLHAFSVTLTSEGQEFSHTKRDPFGNKLYDVYIPTATFKVKSPKNIGKKGYRPIARIDIVRRLEDEVLKTDYITVRFPNTQAVEIPTALAENVCEHCGKKINSRQAIFIIQAPNGKLMQIGRNCLDAYIQVSALELLEEVAKITDLYESGFADTMDDDGFPFHESKIELVDYLRIASSMINKLGYANSKSQLENNTTPTYQQVYDYVEYWNTGRNEIFPRVKEMYEDVEFQSYDDTLAMIEYAKANLSNSEFDRNLRSILNIKFIDSDFKAKHYDAMIAYLPMWVIKHKSQSAEKASVGSSQFVGNVGAKIETNATVTMIKPFESRYGITTLVKMIDASGNILTWFASQEISGSKVGKTVKITGTVKSQEVYNNEKQTTLTRCKMA